MYDTGFKLYLLFIISWFLHLTARFPVLGLIRFDLILISILFFLSSQKASAKRQTQKIDTILKVLFIYCIITLPLVQWPGSVLNKGIPIFIKALIFYFYTVSFVDSEKKLKLFMLIFIACQSFRVLEPTYEHLMYGYWGSQTFVSGGEMMDRLAGSRYDIVNPNGLAFVILSVIPFYHYLSLNSSIKYKILYLMVLPVCLYALVLTSSRTGILGLAVIFIGFFYRSKKKLFFLTALASIVLVIIINLNPLQIDRYLSIVGTGGHFSGSSQGRINGILRDFELGLKGPLMGFGVGTSREANANFMGHNQIVHNLYVEIFVELGLAGLIIFLFFIKSIIVNFREALLKMSQHVSGNSYLQNLTYAMTTWLAMNILFSFASYGLSSYEWYLFGGLSTVLNRLSDQKNLKI